MAGQADRNNEGTTSTNQGQPQAPAKDDLHLQEVAKAFKMGSLQFLKRIRDELDVGVAKIGSLSKEQRSKLSGDAASVGLMFLVASNPFDLRSKEDKATDPPDQRVEALRSIVKVLDMDTSKIPPKQYETLVKQVWKTAKATLDETLERPGVKQLLDLAPPLPK